MTPTIQTLSHRCCWAAIPPAAPVNQPAERGPSRYVSAAAVGQKPSCCVCIVTACAACPEDASVDPVTLPTAAGVALQTGEGGSAPYRSKSCLLSDLNFVVFLLCMCKLTVCMPFTKGTTRLPCCRHANLTLSGLTALASLTNPVEFPFLLRGSTPPRYCKAQTTNQTRRQCNKAPTAVEYCSWV